MYTQPHAFISLDDLRWNDGKRVQSGHSTVLGDGRHVEIRGALVERRQGRFTLVLRCLPLDGPVTDKPVFWTAERVGIRPATAEEMGEEFPRVCRHGITETTDVRCVACQQEA